MQDQQATDKALHPLSRSNLWILKLLYQQSGVDHVQNAMSLQLEKEQQFIQLKLTHAEYGEVYNTSKIKNAFLSQIFNWRSK